MGGADKEKEYKPETVMKKMRAFAQLVRMFYNSNLADQLETLATDFGTLAAYRVSNVRKYPLVLLVSCYESLMFSYVLGVRLQINDLINHLEHMGKSVRRQHIQGNLRLAMAGRTSDRQMAFDWPIHFESVLEPDSCFHEFWNERTAAGIVSLTAAGNGFSVPVVKSSRSGTGASGAAGTDGEADPSDAPLAAAPPPGGGGGGPRALCCSGQTSPTGSRRCACALSRRGVRFVRMWIVCCEAATCESRLT